MSALHTKVRGLLKSLDIELKEWERADPPVEALKIHERLRVIVGLQQILLEDQIPNALKDNRTGEITLIRDLPKYGKWMLYPDYGCIILSHKMRVYYFSVSGDENGTLGWSDVTNRFSFVLAPDSQQPTTDNQ